MENIVLNNANIVFEPKKTSAKKSHNQRRKQQTLDRYIQAVRANHAKLRKKIELFRQHLARLTCSSTWAEDCLYRGTNYAPDFSCQCDYCRQAFPDRLNPRPAHETKISIDCQCEVEEDPEFAEELAKLRNDRYRVGSVVLAASAHDQGRAHVRPRKFGR